MSDAVGGRALEILLVEDNPGDVGLAREGLSECKIPHHVHVVGDGLEASAFLHRKGAYASRPRPDIILLDLNLPRSEERRVGKACGSRWSLSPEEEPDQSA